MSEYKLENNQATFSDYDKIPPFSSFLPGLAGTLGIPLWVFYTNRGQGINSFGIHNKSNAIMEFNPANTAYENTAMKGFRTFIKCNGAFAEPFTGYDSKAKRSLSIKKNSFSILEQNVEHGFNMKVNYFVLPTESIGALVRHVEIENVSGADMELVLLDGMPRILPYGMANGAYKEMSNLLKSWTEVTPIAQEVYTYAMRASSDDSSEVSDILGGYYCFSVMEGERQRIVYDPEMVFGYDTSFMRPVRFLEEDFKKLLEQPQYSMNKMPCGFAAIKKVLAAGKKLQFTTFIGFTDSADRLLKHIQTISSDAYIAGKMEEADQLAEQYLADVKTKTANQIFDQYIEQCYLDNFIRGGYPSVHGRDRNRVLYLFSRKHGDPERDYNFFSIAGDYYSQGNGNFRDVCQNRRNDVFFHPEIGTTNLRYFFSLIQVDGYNPLEIRPYTFQVKESNKEEAGELLAKAVGSKEAVPERLLEKAFQPGELLRILSAKNALLHLSEEELMERLLPLCHQNMEAGFLEGYWSDHWDYLMDLVDNYERIYPDLMMKVLYEEKEYRFYDSIGVILPRSETYVLKNGQVRQYGSLYHDDLKVGRVGFVPGGTNWLRDSLGAVVKVSLAAKMLSIIAIKFAQLDPYGMGIEMEGGKPGWNDAMNGLPGLFGSGMSETIELLRMVRYLKNKLQQELVKSSDGMEGIAKENVELRAVTLPVEISEFLELVADTLKQAADEQWSDFDYWDKIAVIRETYRVKVRYELSGATIDKASTELHSILVAFEQKLELACERAKECGNGLMPTYFTYEAVSFEPLLDETGMKKVNSKRYPLVKVTGFRQHMLPSFLEAPARYIGISDNQEEARSMVKSIRNSELYDEKLAMYKTSVPLGELSLENGRICAFTAGWLERESIFLHMEYKYFLSVLKAGLQDEFYEMIRPALIPFLDPARYGRSTLENSSFLASSVNPDPNVHGRGYVARMSGSTTEMLSMWIEMFLGATGFIFKDSELKLKFEPKLPGWLFDEQGSAGFTMLSKCQVVYENKERKNTYGERAAIITEIEMTTELGRLIKVKGDTICGLEALLVREGKVTEIHIKME